MISDHDRRYYIGASDTHYVMSKFDTKTFQSWWNIKLGLEEGMADNIYTRAGSMWEGEILDSLLVPYRDEQFILGQLRVNLDGRTDDYVVEVKTHQASKEFKVTKGYWQQVQVEMYASCNDKALLVAYGLLEEDYEEVSEVDYDRLETFEIEYDEEWVLEKYLPRFNYLCECWGKEIPSESGFDLYRTRECV